MGSQENISSPLSQSADVCTEMAVNHKMMHPAVSRLIPDPTIPLWDVFFGNNSGLQLLFKDANETKLNFFIVIIIIYFFIRTDNECFLFVHHEGNVNIWEGRPKPGA